MIQKHKISILVITGILILSCKKNDDEIQAKVFKSNGNISTVIDQFRATLGNLNVTPGAATGRREINWDTVTDDFLNTNLPEDFFNPTIAGAPVSRQRGLIYEGGAVQVSNTNFAHINDQAATEFSNFSGSKSFANVESNKWEIGFQVAGQSLAASTQAFGMVFTDVDKENSTALEFFEGNESIGKFFVPARNAASAYSFLAVKFINRKITRVQVSHEGILTDGGKDISQGGSKDLVVMDDVIYSEPVK